MKIERDRIRQILWQKDFFRTLQRDLVDNSVASYDMEYIGKPIETDTIAKAQMQTKNNVFHAMVQMLTAYMMNFVFEECIDTIVDIIEQEQEQETRQRLRGK